MAYPMGRPTAASFNDRVGGPAHPGRRDETSNVASVVGGPMVALVVEAMNMQGDEGAAVRLGRAFKKVREDAGVSGPELARRLTAAGVSEGLTASHIYRWEAGGRPLNLGLIEIAERVMGVGTGTVLRRAGYVDDAGLVDVDTIAPEYRESVRLLLDAARRRKETGGDGVDSQ